MSQHHFSTTHENRPILIVLGWDRPLQGYFMTVERLDVDESSDEDRYLFSNLEWIESYPLALAPFLNELKKRSIGLPSEIREEVESDGSQDAGCAVP